MRCGLNLESVGSEYEVSIDLRGFLVLHPNVRLGVREMRVKFKAKGGTNEQTVQEFVEKSPVYDTVANLLKIKTEVEKVKEYDKPIVHAMRRSIAQREMQCVAAFNPRNPSASERCAFGCMGPSIGSFHR